MYTLSEIIDTMMKKGYVVYNQPYRLNVVGIRTNNPTSLTFDDYIAYFYYDDKGKVIGKVAPATTDPSVQYLKNPLPEVQDLGTAILKSGQYLDAYKIGLHKGKYTALVQTKPITVIRDNDRNSLLNLFAKTTTGNYGINIHKASGNSNYIGPDSAGCQVFRNVSDFNQMMSLAQISKGKYGNNFTYTLLDEMDDLKYKRNIGLVIGGVALVFGFGYLAYKKFRK